MERDHLMKVEEEKKRGGRDAEEVEAVVDAIGKMDLELAERYGED